MANNPSNQPAAELSPAAPKFGHAPTMLLESGLGVSLVPGNVKSLNRPQVVIRAITPPSARIPLCLIWRKPAENPALAAFVEIVHAARPALQAKMGRRE